ncbi:two-component system response regulator [Chitiniphilus eburneus]|uniref:EAL domain-containing protein n=1 Tax=Chitiniphilus eburneus TaxID=2571148 RepID=A0A4V5MQW1_9NEIS|nr:EAL domain-containing protein [Chitiniphilus eburneus]TJZ74088.1 EAL domain-containing protein [Chitiniphilus eburneus]
MNPRIMIVEDERIVALDLKHSLEFLGYQAVGVHASGEDAIAHIPTQQPDLVLMDINLGPGMDGTEAALVINAEHKVPIVFLTAYAEEKTLSRAERSMPYGYLLKPYELRELDATLRMALARRQAELEVEHAEERLRLAMDAAALGVWEWDPQSDDFQWQGHLEGILGGRPRFLRGEQDAFLDFIHEEDRPAVAAQLAENDVVSSTVRMRQPDGSLGWIELYAKRYAEHDRTRVIGVVRDVTERHRNEERLRQANVVFQTTGEGVLITDPQHRVIATNPAFSLLTGYAAEDIYGFDPDNFLHARRHSDHFYPRLLETRQGYWHGEVTCLRRDGTPFPAWEHVCAVRDERGELRNFIITFSDISEIRQAEEQINHLAYHDALTGLGNRHQLAARLDTELERAQLSRQPVAVMFIDLDGFKLVNDTLGHAAGDILLQTVARRIKGSLRRTDIAIRLGGDEFVVIVPDARRLEDYAALAEKLLEAVREVIELRDERLSISASIGIAVFPDNGTDSQTLLKSADNAMYDAKMRGRNRVAFYSPDMAERAHERMAMEQGLMQALKTDALHLHYQPVISLADGKLVGVEALLRWHHPELGQVPPARFIPVAEESGLIDRIGAWVLRQACRQALAWQQAGHPPLRMAVNVSVRQLAQDHLVENVAAVLAETGLAPECLELEITETAIQSIEHSRERLRQLKALGVMLAIDDFGTGFSSLSLLKHLPIDRIKIDRSFVMGLPDDGNDAAITQAIIALAQNLKMALTAEGIESPEQLTFLQRQGVEDAQGYLFSRPQPPQALESLLHTRQWQSMQ